MTKDRSIIVTGGGGMLAAAVVRAAERRGINAIALRRDECDIAIDTDREKLFELHRPAVLINCAAHTKVDLCETEREKAILINGHAPGLLATLCKTHGTRLVHYSTDFVFDGSKQTAYTEEDATGPVSVYGESKLMGEEAIRRVGPDGYLILRTAWLYGQPGHCFPKVMVDLAKHGKQLRVVNDQFGCPTLTDDLAEATFDLLDRGASGLFHVTNSGSTNWFEFAKAALAEFGVEYPVEAVSSEEWQKIRPTSAKRPGNSRLSLQKLERVIGRGMRGWREALREYRGQTEL